MWAAFLFSSVNALITLPRASRLLFMLIPSLRVDPVAPVFLILSDPARSTKWNLALMYSVGWAVCIETSLASSRICYSIVMVKMPCEREDAIFISVDAVVRALEPISSCRAISSRDFTVTSFSPYTEIVPFFSSLTVISFFWGLPLSIPLSSRSMISSLYISRKLHLMVN